MKNRDSVASMPKYSTMAWCSSTVDIASRNCSEQDVNSRNATTAKTSPSEDRTPHSPQDYHDLDFWILCIVFEQQVDWHSKGKAQERSAQRHLEEVAYGVRRASVVLIPRDAEV